MVFNFLKNTARALVRNVVDTVEAEGEFLNIDDVEDLLISADLGVNYAAELADMLRKSRPSQIKEFLKKDFLKTLHLAGSSKLNIADGLNIYLIVGVNGAGKTTLIGKLSYKFKQEGKKVLIAAGDTFRAAAEEQLDVWAQRAGADIVRRNGADPASVVYEAIQKAKDDAYDVLLVDTAGRLQNKYNLMEELSKIKTVIDKNASLQESMLVLDANTGQNGIQQAKVFLDAVKLTSAALTKLDGSAKGAIVLAIAKDMKLPVKLIGVGEKIEDLREFDAEEFINALFE
jgi:fused signal recognition particle receptor